MKLHKTPVEPCNTVACMAKETRITCYSSVHLEILAQHQMINYKCPALISILQRALKYSAAQEMEFVIHSST